MNAQGEKTGGRQKGTPNKVNASVKLRVKDFLFKNEELMQEAFEKAKPGERLNFYYKMLNLVCAKQTSSKDDGEWRPGDDIDTEWTSGLEKYRRQYQNEEDYSRMLLDEHHKIDIEANNYKKEYYQEGRLMVEALKEGGLMQKAMDDDGEEEFWKRFNNAIDQAITKLLEARNIQPTVPVNILPRQTKYPPKDFNGGVIRYDPVEPTYNPPPYATDNHGPNALYLKYNPNIHRDIVAQEKEQQRIAEEEKEKRQTTGSEVPTDLSAGNEKKTAYTVNKGPETATAADSDTGIKPKDGETPDEREERLKAMMIPQTAATPLSFYREKKLHDDREYRHLM